jgi:hypothetical protein
MWVNDHMWWTKWSPFRLPKAYAKENNKKNVSINFWEWIFFFFLLIKTFLFLLKYELIEKVLNSALFDYCAKSLNSPNSTSGDAATLSSFFTLPFHDNLFIITHWTTGYKISGDKMMSQLSIHFLEK